jgi:hypothetical protein
MRYHREVVTRAASSFCPEERPRVAIASDGTLAAIHEPARVSVVELPGCAAFAEVAIAGDAIASEVAWIGAPPRLLVVSRYPTHAIAYLVDPYGPRTIAELRIEESVRLSGVVGTHALLLGAQAATVITASETQLAAYTFPARGGVPSVAGGGATCFVVAVPGVAALEEWDPQGRIPKRRIKLPHAGTVAAVGGSDRVAWCTWREQPRRVDAIPVVQRGQPKSHELPEPIAEVAAHPRSDLIACLGAEGPKASTAPRRSGSWSVASAASSRRRRGGRCRWSCSTPRRRRTCASRRSSEKKRPRSRSRGPSLVPRLRRSTGRRRRCRCNRRCTPMRATGATSSFRGHEPRSRARRSRASRRPHRRSAT